MLDPLALLNNLLHIKVATQEEDDFDFPVHVPKAKVQAKVPPLIGIPKKPTLSAEVKSNPTPSAVPIPVTIQTARPIEEFDFPVFRPKSKEKLKSEISEVPAVAAPQDPLSVSQVPSKTQPELIPQPAPESETKYPVWAPSRKIKLEDEFPTSHWNIEYFPVNESMVSSEEVPALPSWFDQTWKPTRKIKEPEKLEPDIISTEDAKIYLRALPKEEHLTDALEALDILETELQKHRKNKSLILDAISYTSSHLSGLIEHADIVFGNNKEKGIKATKILIDSLNAELNKLPQHIRERSGKKVLKALEGRKQVPIRELSSKYYGPAMIFINNRTIRLATAGTGIPFVDAEQQATEEWESISKFINELGIDNESYKDKLQRLGAQELLSGNSIDDAKTRISQSFEAVKSGLISFDDVAIDDNTLSEIFQNTKVDTEEWVDIAEYLTDEEKVKDDMEGLSEAMIERLVPNIVKFGEESFKFSKYKDAWSRDKTNFDLGNNLQITYDSVILLAQRLFINPNDIKLAQSIFEDIYAVYVGIREEAQEPGLELESMSDTPLSEAESAEAGLAIDVNAPQKQVNKKNYREKQIDETQEEYEDRRANERARAEASNQRYLRRILNSGRGGEYLERRLQHTRQKRKEDPKQIGMDLIRNPVYNETRDELNKFRYFATTKNVEDLSGSMQKLFRAIRDGVDSFYTKIFNSELPSDILSQMENDLQRYKIRKFRNEYNNIKKLNGNPRVLVALELAIESLPRYFKEAKERSHQEKVSSARVINDMASVFLKTSLVS